MYKKAKAFLSGIAKINFPWSLIGKLFLLVPSFISDPCYDVVAKYRYKLFGKVKNKKI